MSEDATYTAAPGEEQPFPWEPGTTVESIRADLAARASNYILLERRDPYGYAAFLLAALDAAPGVRALQAGYEEAEHWRATWEARAMTRATERDEARRENTQLWAALLETLSDEQRHALWNLAHLTRLTPMTFAEDGWLRAGWVLAQLGPDKYEALLTLPARMVERLEAYGTVSGYRLTPFGARVAEAIKGEG